MRNKYRPELTLLCALAIVTSLLFGYTVAAKGWSYTLTASPHIFLANFFGGPLFFVPFVAIGLYLTYKLAEMLVFRGGRKKFLTRRAVILWDILVYLLLVGGFSSLFALSVKFVFLSASPSWTAEAGQALMALDYSLFGRFTGGVYPAFALNAVSYSPIFEEMIILSYTELVALLSLGFGALFTFHPRLLRQFVIAIFLCGIFALPVWTLLPAVSPHHLYRKNILKIEIPENIEEAVKNHTPSPRLEEFLEASDIYWLDPTEESYPVSANPSMHMSWAVVLLVYSLFFASWAGRKLVWAGPVILWGSLVVPWFVFNAIGTIYTLQHYAVDLLLGSIIAVVAIFLSQRALPASGSSGRLARPACWLLVKEDLTRYLRRNKKSAHDPSRQN